MLRKNFESRKRRRRERAIERQEKELDSLNKELKRTNATETSKIKRILLQKWGKNISISNTLAKL